jgi:hypothetical protein
MKISLKNNGDVHADDVRIGTYRKRSTYAWHFDSTDGRFTGIFSFSKTQLKRAIEAQATGA